MIINPAFAPARDGQGPACPYSYWSNYWSNYWSRIFLTRVVRESKLVQNKAQHTSRQNDNSGGTMNLLSRVRRPFIFAALVLALMLSGAFLRSSRGGSAHEVSTVTSYGHSTEYTYYSDASHTVEVGSRYINCAGRATTSGTVTPYYTSEIIDVCCGSVPC
jgi:hypothetical protein